MLCQERKRYPVGVGAGLLSQTCADIREGKTHCVVWAAGGMGWQKAQQTNASGESGAPLTQKALLDASLEARRKATKGIGRAPVVADPSAVHVPPFAVVLKIALGLF